MIAYNLVCAKGHEFEGWFQGGAAYETQEADGVLACPLCGDTHIRKAIMAPSIRKSAVTPAQVAPAGAHAAPVDPQKLRQFMAGYRKFVEENADYVGPRFPEEARKIHYGE